MRILKAAERLFPDSRSMTAEESEAIYSRVRSLWKPVVDALPCDPEADDRVDALMAPVRNAGEKKRLLRRKP